MSERTKPDLAMNWSRTEGMPVIRCDGAELIDRTFLASCLGTGFLAELERRGYDLKTLRFSIRKAVTRG